MIVRPTDPPALRFQAVGKSFGTAVALRDVGFDVPAGACFGLVGVNGAGKTTLIRCLLDANRATSGGVEIFGEPGTATAARRHVAFLPERFSAPFYLTGRDFLTLMAKLYDHPTTDVEVFAALDALDLARDALDRSIRTWSKGMAQKLGLAACLLSGRDLLVLDEPASGLDPRARAALKAALRARQASGATIFLTSHALADVDEMCDRMAVLHGGRLLFSGTPAELRARHGAASLEDAFLAALAAAESPYSRAR